MEELEEKAEVNYTGVIAAAILLPIALIVYHFGNADMAISTFLTLGMAVFATVIRWSLRNHVWFWITLLVVAALHVPVILALLQPLHLRLEQPAKVDRSFRVRCRGMLHRTGFRRGQLHLFQLCQ